MERLFGLDPDGVSLIMRCLYQNTPDKVPKHLNVTAFSIRIILIRSSSLATILRIQNRTLSSPVALTGAAFRWVPW